MSHSPERSEKVCLNCGALLHGRYCHVCGQENVEPKETVGHLIRHFFEDITHFDGKFFSTIRLLVTRPGYLSAEYTAGRRTRYINPIRMYLFISFIFFFIFFTFFKDRPVTQVRETTTTTKTANGKDSIISRHRDTINSASNSIRITAPTPSTANATHSLAKYLAEQDSLPEDKRDGAIARYFSKKMLVVQNEVADNKEEFVERVKDRFWHSFPQMLFVLLPIFALLLSLLYIRRKKDFNYVAHAIFTIHLYCFIFLAWLLIFLLKLIPAISIVATLVLFAIMLIYQFIAMRKFYKQGKGKTFLKMVLLNTSFLVVFTIVSILYLLTAAINAV